MKRQRSTSKEDSELLNLVEKYGQNWILISSLMKNRNKKQAKERFFYFLSPELNKGSWKEEDILLLKKVNEYGKKWQILRNFFPQRSNTSIKNRYAFLNRKSILKEAFQEQKISNLFDEDFIQFLETNDPFLMVN